MCARTTCAAPCACCSAPFTVFLFLFGPLVGVIVTYLGAPAEGRQYSYGPDPIQCWFLCWLALALSPDLAAPFSLARVCTLAATVAWRRSAGRPAIFAVD